MLTHCFRGGSRIFGQGVQICRGWGEGRGLRYFLRILHEKEKYWRWVGWRVVGGTAIWTAMYTSKPSLYTCVRHISVKTSWYQLLIHNTSLTLCVFLQVKPETRYRTNENRIEKYWITYIYRRCFLFAWIFSANRITTYFSLNGVSLKSNVKQQ